MKIRINEVWNYDGKSVELAVIEVVKPIRYGMNLRPSFKEAAASVQDWVQKNRPDLSLADGLNSHGYHAVAI